MYSTKFENLDELDNCLDSYQVPKLKQDHINHLKSPEEIEAVVNNLQSKRSLGPDGFSGEFYQLFKEELFKLFHKIKTEGTLHSSVHEITIMLIPKPNNNQTKKENFRPISFMNIDAKILNKILPN